MARLLFGVPYRDPGCPFRLFRRDIFARIPLQSKGPFVHVEIVAKANFLGCLLGEEVPLGETARPVSTEESHSTTRGILADAWTVFHYPDFGPAVLTTASAVEPPLAEGMQTPR